MQIKDVSITSFICILWFWLQFDVYKHSKISKTTKLHEPEGQVQFVVFEKFTSAHYAKLQEKSCYYLLIMYMKKIKRQD